MDGEIRQDRDRFWSGLEKALLGLTFGCFAVMGLAVSAVSMAHLVAGPAGWPVRLACLALSWLAAAGAAALCLRTKGDGRRRFALVLFLAALALKGAFAAAVDTQPISDFAVLYNAAVGLARDGTDLSGQFYFQLWPYQSGFVAYMAVLIRLFGADVLFFKLTNAVYAALTSVLVYLLAGRFASEGSARGAAVLYTLYPGTWLLVPVLTNQHLSELLFAAAVYLYTAPAEGLKKRLSLAGLAGAVLALGNAIRPVAVVALAAAGCLMILAMLRERQSGWRAVRDAAIRFVLFAAAYAVVMAGLGGLIRAAGVNEYGLGSSCPEWKFACGLNESTSGSYSGEDSALVFGSEDPRQTARELALERLRMPPARLARLFGQKIYTMWGSFEAVEWTLTENVVEQLEGQGLPLGAEQLKKAVRLVSCGFYTLCFLLAAAAGAAALKGRARREETAQLLALAALAYFGVHLLIEIQPRYRSLMLAVVFPLLAMGIDGVRALWSAGKTLKIED